ncbi:predicted protein [Streptomyces filamentosus NRRL 15998]|uniref:Predicted protein n=1 Tax=Streptomyces filamentosus NRRL 15998 TaxID=457431 RepID=D6AN51_STRFL|nr:predicted protein [Streptomyces filamentosus NRRL 15998]
MKVLGGCRRTIPVAIRTDRTIIRTEGANIGQD